MEEPILQQILLIPGDPSLADRCVYSMNPYREALKLHDESVGGIVLCGFQQQIDHPLAGSAGGVSRGNGRPKIGDIHCCKEVDDITPILLERCLNGEPLGLGGYTTQVLICNAEGNQLHLRMGYRLSNALITSFTTELVDGHIKDRFTLNASAIEWYRLDTEGDENIVGWDLNNSRPLKRK